MKTICALTAMTLALFLVVATEAQDKKGETKSKLIGVWELVKGSGPPGSTLEFKNEGQLIMIAKLGDKTLKLEGTYKVEGKKVTAIYKSGDKEINDPATIETLTDTQLITVDGKGKKDEFKKLKPK